MTSSEPTTNRHEIAINGLPAAPGLAIGNAFLYRKQKPVISTEPIDPVQVPGHIERFREAKNIIEGELQRLRKSEIDANLIEIIDAQIEIVNDPDLEEQVTNSIENEHHTVDFAIQKVFEPYLNLLEQTGNHNAQERIVDIEDIRDRMIQVANNYSLDLNIEAGAIVVAKDISPREVILFAERDIKGIVIDRGGKTSHATIIARSMGIPAVVGTKRASKQVEDGATLIIDGNEGRVVSRPTTETRGKYEQKLEQQRRLEKEYSRVLSQPNETSDGSVFNLRANIEFAAELPNLQQAHAEGIGLLRTESVYLRREHFDDHSKQVAFYSEILEETGDYPVTIRLFDAGGDKIFAMSSREKNPFLGWRGIRMLLDERELLREQLRAICTVAGRYPGRVRLLVPMVSVLEEVTEVKKELFDIQEELVSEKVPVDEELPVGIMVEVPSVAIRADRFAAHVDFFSIGTNDLTQYLLAADRGNELISDLYQQNDPAVWKMIEYTVSAALKHDIDVSVCGELAAHPEAAACMMGMGIRDLSASPAFIPKVKTVLTGHSIAEMEALAKEVLEAGNAADVLETLNRWNKA